MIELSTTDALQAQEAAAEARPLPHLLLAGGAVLAALAAALAKETGITAVGGLLLLELFSATTPRPGSQRPAPLVLAEAQEAGWPAARPPELVLEVRRSFVGSECLRIDVHSPPFFAPLARLMDFLNQTSRNTCFRFFFFLLHLDIKQYLAFGAFSSLYEAGPERPVGGHAAPACAAYPARGCAALAHKGPVGATWRRRRYAGLVAVRCPRRVRGGGGVGLHCGPQVAH